MSEEAHDRTEPATPRRREEARQQGQVAYSPDLLGSALLLAGVLGITYLGPAAYARLRGLVVEALRRPTPSELGPADAADLLSQAFAQSALAAGPLLGLLVAVAFTASAFMAGLHITPERLGPDFDKLSPAAGMGRLFSLGAVVKGLLALIKIAVLGALVAVLLRARAGTFQALGDADIGSGIALAWGLVLRMALYLAVAFAALGAADYAYQRYRLEQSLRMTKQEVKEETKREEGDPQVKLRHRQIGRELARRRMIADVPAATVVITNPTHVALALRYDRGVMRAPRVVAKGAGVIARRIAARARECGVPVLERPPLARALYRAVDLGREVPPELFVAVAEVIAFVYRLRGLDRPGGGGAQ